MLVAASRQWERNRVSAVLHVMYLKNFVILCFYFFTSLLCRHRLAGLPVSCVELVISVQPVSTNYVFKAINNKSVLMEILPLNPILVRSLSMIGSVVICVENLNTFNWAILYLIKECYTTEFLRIQYLGHYCFTCTFGMISLTAQITEILSCLPMTLTVSSKKSAVNHSPQ